MLRDILEPLPSVQIIQVSSFSSVLITCSRFHCMQSIKIHTVIIRNFIYMLVAVIA